MYKCSLAFRNFDNQVFLYDLNERDLDRLSLIPDPDLALVYFSNAFNTITDKHAPITRLQIKDRRTVWFSHELSEIIPERNLAWAKARKKGLLWNEFCSGSCKIRF